MYCSENWAQTKVTTGYLKSADMKALRRITGVNYEKAVTNEAVIKMTGLVNPEKFGHVLNDHSQKI